MYKNRVFLLLFSCTFLLFTWGHGKSHLSLVFPPVAPVIVANPADPNICETESVLLSVTPVNGVTYQWQRDGQNIGATNSQYRAETTGRYTVVATDNTGSTTSSNEIAVVVRERPVAQSISPDGSIPVCPDETITLSVQQDNNVDMYEWVRNGTAVGQNSPTFTPTNSGSYSVRLINACGITPSNNSVDISIGTATSTRPQTGDVSLCGPGSLTLSATAGADGSYRWFTSDDADAVAIAGETSGSFVTPELTQTTSYYVAIDNGSCISEKVKAEAIILNIPTAAAGEDVVINAGERITIGFSGTAGEFYRWEPTVGLNDPTIPNPVASPTASTTYTLTVTNAEDCFAVDDVLVTVISTLSVSSGFSPNNDGTNDIWEIKNIESYPDCEVTIINRWGNIVYHSVGYTNPWDGTRSGKELPVDTYYYIIDLKNEEPLIRGNITLLR